MAERSTALGYMAIKAETTAGTPVLPDVFTPYYKESLTTDNKQEEDDPIIGQKFQGYNQLPGTRAHTGSATVMAEPNSAARWIDMLLTRGAVSGSNPYTWPFTLSNTTDPKTYTIDISKGGAQVVRFWGCGASKLTPTYSENKMQFEIDLSGLGSFYGREIASVSGSGPYIVTLKDPGGVYDGVPTKGLVVGDLIWFKLANGTNVSATVASVSGDTTFTTSTNPTAAIGDMVTLRAATPSLNILTPFLWTRTRFYFGADAAAALALAATAHTRLERDTEVVIEHMFEDNEGSKRSGSFDPASLPRTQGNYSFKVKKFFDDPLEIKSWNAQNKTACIMRCFSETGYELRITMNNLKSKTLDIPTEQSGIGYQEIDAGTSYDVTDGQGMDMKVINALASL